MSRWHSVGIIGLLLCAGSLGLLVALLSPPTEQFESPEALDISTGAQRPAGHNLSLSVTNQDAGMRFFIGTVQTDRASWVVVYSDDNTGPLGAFFFPQYNGIQSGGGVLQRPLTSGAHYRAVLHEDDGDMSFHLENDPPLLDEAGRPVQTEFYTR